LEIKKIAAEETIDIRHRVMWPDRPRRDVILADDMKALHFGAFKNGQLVAVGSFFNDSGVVRLRKLAVEHEHQGNGIASTLLQAAIEDLRHEGCTRIWCDARVSASEFYLRNGFSLDARVFQKRGIDYVVASRVL